MPESNDLRQKHMFLLSDPFMVADERGEILFSGRFRLLFDAQNPTIEIKMLASKRGVHLVQPANGTLEISTKLIYEDDERTDVA